MAANERQDGADRGARCAEGREGGANAEGEAIIRGVVPSSPETNPPNGSAPAPDDAVCLLCAGRLVRRFQSHGYWIADCEACGHRCAAISPAREHVERIYGDDYFGGGGAGYSNYLEEGPLLTRRARRYAEILARYRPPGRILDVGCAAGFLLKGFEDAGWTGQGLEPNAAMAEHGRRILGLRIETGTLEDFHAADTFDVVSMIQVIAHFVNPRQALRAAAQATRPGGLWLVETWDYRSWTARAFGRAWHEYSPPSVLHWFSPASLGRLVSEFGMHEVGRGRLGKWIQAAHAKSLVAHKVAGSSAGPLVRGLLRLIPDGLRLPYPSEDLFWAVYQKRDDA